MITFAINDEDTDLYVASLALGLLEAMRTGDLPTSHGIWTLGRPVFWKVLEEKSLVAAPILKVVQTFDEIDAAEELGLDVAELIERLMSELRTSIKSTERETSLAIRTEHGT